MPGKKVGQSEVQWFWDRALGPSTHYGCLGGVVPLGHPQFEFAASVSLPAEIDGNINPIRSSGLLCQRADCRISSFLPGRCPMVYVRWVDGPSVPHQVGRVQRLLPGVLKQLSRLPLLYVPLDRGGKVREILAATGRPSVGGLIDGAECDVNGNVFGDVRLRLPTAGSGRSFSRNRWHFLPFDRHLAAAHCTSFEAATWPRLSIHWLAGNF